MHSQQEKDSSVANSIERELAPPSPPPATVAKKEKNKKISSSASTENQQKKRSRRKSPHPKGRKSEDNKASTTSQTKRCPVDAVSELSNYLDRSIHLAPADEDNVKENGDGLVLASASEARERLKKKRVSFDEIPVEIHATTSVDSNARHKSCPPPPTLSYSPTAPPMPTPTPTSDEDLIRLDEVVEVKHNNVLDDEEDEIEDDLLPELQEDDYLMASGGYDCPPPLQEVNPPLLNGLAGTGSQCHNIVNVSDVHLKRGESTEVAPSFSPTTLGEDKFIEDSSNAAAEESLRKCAADKHQRRATLPAKTEGQEYEPGEKPETPSLMQQGTKPVSFRELDVCCAILRLLMTFVRVPLYFSKWETLRTSSAL